MPESVAMPPEDTVAKSPLDKPLHLLTEEDISQLTREDCRRYLKEKGMRRPSWNKSQAIQQVISLKTLLESDSDAGTRKKLYIPRPEIQQRVHRGTSADTEEVSASAEDSFSNRPKDADKADLSGDLSARQHAENDSPPIRTTGVTNGPVGQMTIFYCGKVNVYDDVPSDKAQAIMQLAASPLHLPGEGLNDAVRSLPIRLQAASVKGGPDHYLMPGHPVKMADNPRLHRQESNISIEDHPAEGPPSRKASVLRYLEKRKDRLKSKRKVGTPLSSSWDLYLNHQIGYQIPNEHSSRSGPCSPPPIKPPDTPNRCSSVENNLVKSADLSAAHNEKDFQADIERWVIPQG